MTDTVQSLAALEYSGYGHESRLLILIDEFTSGTDPVGIRGLTKLSKLDFLLRYPTYLERALKARNASARSVNVRDYERRSMEARMVRYRFGPWDHRYPETLRGLEARGLITIAQDGRTVVLRTTRRGADTAKTLRSLPEFEDMVARVNTLRKRFDLTASNLMKFIYETFPEVVNLRSNETISI